MAASNIYQESNPLECKICRNPYNEDHCPRILPCSHEFCNVCLKGLISTRKKHCPLCRKGFSTSTVEDLMINRGLVDVAKQLSSLHLGSRTSTSAPKKSILEFRPTKDFSENIGKGIAVCQETEAEVKARIESNNDRQKRLQEFIQTLEEMKLSTEKTLSNIDQNNKELMNKLDIMQKEQLNMKESKRKLETAPDSASAGATMGEACHIFLKAEAVLDEITQLLRENDRRRDDMRQDTLKMKISLENALGVVERMVEEEQQQQQQVQEQETEQEQEEEEEEEERDSVVKITVSDLRSPHGRLRGDAQREIFAVMTFEGKLRLAPVKIESNNQVSFTHLEEGVLPPRCFVIELESLIPGGGSPSPPLSPPPPRGFLDLAYGPTPLGRVIIRVTVDGLQGRNFLLMCAGGMGDASYAHSGVSYVWNKGGEGEYMLMGQYVSHGGGGRGGTTSTRAVLPSREEDWEREWESGTYEETPYKAGDVRGFISYERASEFWIVTRDNPSGRFNNCFGMVEEGLDVLKSAISKYKDIHKVEVANCGLIL